MRNPRDSFCSYCGSEFNRPLRYPRKCPNPGCGADVYANPIPVALALLPILVGERTGLLVVRRAIEPQLGKLALVGGFVEEYETWQQGAAREVWEEAGIRIDPAGLTPYFLQAPNLVQIACCCSRLDRRCGSVTFPRLSKTTKCPSAA